MGFGFWVLGLGFGFWVVLVEKDPYLQNTSRKQGCLTVIRVLSF